MSMFRKRPITVLFMWVPVLFAARRRLPGGRARAEHQRQHQRDDHRSHGRRPPGRPGHGQEHPHRREPGDGQQRRRHLPLRGPAHRAVRGDDVAHGLPDAEAAGHLARHRPAARPQAHHAGGRPRDDGERHRVDPADADHLVHRADVDDGPPGPGTAAERPQPAAARRPHRRRDGDRRRHGRRAAGQPRRHASTACAPRRTTGASTARTTTTGSSARRRCCRTPTRWKSSPCSRRTTARGPRAPAPSSNWPPARARTSSTPRRSSSSATRR